MKVTYKNISVHYTDEGEGTPVVLLHGFLENSTMWKEIIPQLSKSNRVIAIDLLGHGETECLGYIHTMEQMAEAVDFVLEHLKISKSIFIGHSMGGYVALAYAELFKDKVISVCLMNSTSMADSDERKKNRDRAIEAVKQNSKTFVSMAVANLFAEYNREKFSDKIEEVKKEALKIPVQGIIAALEGMKIRKDRTDFWRESKFKKLMILGKNDPVLEYDKISIEAENAGVENVVFSDGHMSHIENFNELAYNLMRFIEK